jgi:DNA-directed RNA polymerase specialized sigma24 family protein
LWQQKLKASGFVDIENEYGLLHSWDSFRFATIDPDHFYAVREKYLEAAQLPEMFDFRDPEELVIWNHYADGLSYRDIGKLVGRNKDSIQKTIWKLNSIFAHLKRANERREE